MTDTQKETLGFQTEIKQLLDLMIHSLYSNRDIFLRELISNASDACDKLRFEALDNDALYGGDSELGIWIEVDKAARTISIRDNGIGMNRDEAIKNLGTIARSGTKEFFSQLTGDRARDSNLIGQFGVGFYSSFIVADRVTVESRRAGDPASEGIRWVSSGDGEFTIETIEREQRGTTVTLHIRPNDTDTEDGHEYDSLLEAHKLRSLVRNYSDHIALPVRMKATKWDADKQEMVETGEWEVVNQAKALWLRPKSEITEKEYDEFYKHISHDFEGPLAYTHNRVEGRTEYTQLLYIPKHAPFDLWDRQQRHGIRLYVRRVFIMDDAEQLMPAYLRFVKGVVDSNDLPLNVSREILQESRDVKLIREGNIRRVLSLLEDMADNKPADYESFWAQFGQVLKEGVGEDSKNREKIAGLLRFATTGGPVVAKASEAEVPQASDDDVVDAVIVGEEGGKGDTEATAADTAKAAADNDKTQVSGDGLISLAQYKARMKEGQKAIYYVTSDTEAGARNSPQLEIFKKKGIEVLLLSDRVDEWMLSFLHEFDGTPLVSVAKGGLDLGELADEAEKQAAEAVAADLKGLTEKLKSTLGDRVKDVKVSNRLTDSAACLVSDEGDMSGTLERLLKQAGQPVPSRQPILEINAEHPLVQRLKAEDAQFDDWSSLLFDQALLADGGTLDDPAGFVRRMNALLLATR
ncbi:MAG: molecular chaperone HtpG [Lautropia sp.]|nr:molecular chaperone HtpG [Lautropia sp.]